MPARRTRPFRSRRWRAHSNECRLRSRSVAVSDSPTIKKPSVTLTESPASAVPRASSSDFVSIPGTLPMPPPAKSGSKWNVSSTTWLAGSDISRLRFSSSVILNLRKGMSTSARTATSSDCQASLMISVPCHRANVSLAVRIGGVFVKEHRTLGRGWAGRKQCKQHMS